MKINKKGGILTDDSPLWICFSLLVGSNLVLAYVPAGMETKLWLGLLGLVLPLIFLARKLRPEDHSRPEAEPLPPPPVWVWWAFGVLALVVRFHRLTTLTGWPHYDEGMTGYYAMELSKNPSGRLFYESSQTPPAYLWGLGLFFRIFGVSLESLWAFPAVLSLLTVPAAYFAARQFYSKSTSIMAGLFMAFSFWPLFVGRFSLMSALVLLWECIIIYLLGRSLKASGILDRNRWAMALGCATGLGFYIGLHWIAVAGLMVLTMGITFLPKAPKCFLYFLTPSLLLPLPLAAEAFRLGYGAYFGHLWAFHQALPVGDQWWISLSYIASLFWGLPADLHTFQPVFGGFLNPLLASLCFLGLVILLRNRANPSYRWTALALVLFFLPGLLTKECEPLRILPLIPFLLLLAALGILRLLSTVPEKHRLLALAFLMTASFSLDFYHLNVRYSGLWDSPDNWKGYAKSIERKRAFGILERIQQERGPGLVFSNFTTGLCDQSLSVADYSFNAVGNPGLSTESAQWAALLANVNYRPFLDKRFGASQAFALSTDLKPPDGGWMLWVVPLTSSNRQAFARWIHADQSLGPFIDKTLSRTADESYRNTVPSLLLAQPAFKGDPYLESCFWEKTSELFVKEGFLNRTTPDLRWIQKGVEMLEKAAAEGFPSAHLYNHLGNLCLLEQNTVEAQKYFRLAAKAPVNYTNSDFYLK